LLKRTDFFSDALALVSTDGTIDTSNRLFAEQLGVAPEDLAGRRLEALAAASAVAIQEYLRACAASADVVQESLILRRRADTIALHARGIAYPPDAAPSASQILLRLVTASKPATARSQREQDAHRWKEIEESLRRQSQILEVTLASIGDAVIVTDVQGHVTFVNSVAAALTGWRADEAQGRPLTEIFPIINERTRLPVENPVAKVLSTGTIVGLANHTTLLARDGREIPIDDSAAPIRLPDGQMFGVVLIFRDITDQRRAEHARAWLAAIIDSSDDAIVSKTLDGRITSWNPGAVRLFGYAPDEIIGKPITTIIPPELHAEEEQVLARLRRGERVEHFETERLRKDGTRIEVSLTVSPVRDEHGEIVGASKIARDITERKRSERLLREADHRKDEFLAMLAHELRNPLAPLRNAAELLCRGKHAAPELQIACGIMDRQLRQMTRLVDDLLDVSRISTGRLELKEELIDVGALLRGLESALRPSVDASHQKLSLQLPDETLCVQADRTRLTQILTNILHNANKYTPDGGRITVQLRREGHEALVSIRDTGIGIPPGMLDRIFELFAQVDRSHERSRGGLGIGLTLAKRLVNLQKGSIAAYSAGEGQGSEFVVRLPLQGDAAGPVPAPPSAPTPGVAKRCRVLVADDNEDAALSLGMLLQLMGHDTRVVHDGLEALDVAETFQPELVILDLDMPRVDGYEAARRIRQRPWAHGVMLVALTGWGQTADRLRTEQAGFDRHCVKPVEPDTLSDLVAQVGKPQRQ
jgi:PAS domain S-box-containing protein